MWLWEEIPFQSHQGETEQGILGFFGGVFMVFVERWHKGEKGNPTILGVGRSSWIFPQKFAEFSKHTCLTHTRLHSCLRLSTDLKTPDFIFFLGGKGVKTRTSVNKSVRKGDEESVKYFNHWQGLRKFHSFVMLYFITIIFTDFSLFFFCFFFCIFISLSLFLSAESLINCCCCFFYFFQTGIFYFLFFPKFSECVWAGTG